MEAVLLTELMNLRLLSQLTKLRLYKTTVRLNIWIRKLDSQE